MDNTTSTIIIAIVLTAIAFLVIVSRSVLRKIQHEKFRLDDWLMIGASLFYVAFTVILSVVVYNGTNTIQTEPDKLTDDAVARITLASKLVFVGRIFYTTYLWCLKGCMLIYYTRLPIRPLAFILVELVGGIVIVTWVLCMASFFLECRPIELYWQVLPSAPECAKAGVEIIVVESLNIFTNVFIMAIPTPLLLRSSLSVRNKVEVSGLFIGGFFIIAVSILRLLIVLGPLAMQNNLIWAQVACFAATVIVNAPIVHEIWWHGWRHIHKRRFGRDHCWPEYNLAVRPPTQSIAPRHSSRLLSQDRSSCSEPENDVDRDETVPARGVKASLAIRRSARRISDKLRRNLERLEIKTSTLLVQHSKSGVMTPTTPPEIGPNRDDFFLNPIHGKEATARIKTEISSAQQTLSDCNGPKGHITRFFKRDQGCS